ncbi:serine/threonine-protein kinase [Chitinimonas taiwanensis]|uniref:non-specific serine/threonine protein kinase n=1 Tax=Chitinimonas taiwanensis DSM 18899 TaxID=1121279 RepID=A0A1K2HRZ4_9NEIS|nr:serine/threonine-protein kinase [Chitinimonas taiwanensis]SFZ79518.1 serine/threonine protein kinase [Chitinimonas taiwanensis DSM 18899]
MEKLGHYRIQDTLGEGAMGVVYRAVDERLDRTVALKVLRLHLNPAERSEYAARLQQEARSAARLNHAGIITMYDCGDENGHAYLAMEYVEGKPLQSLLDQGIRLPLNRVLKLADQLFAALAYAHEHDVVHRDIKPANLMLKADGRLKITDFGIAQLPASELTRTGTIVGSPRHMAPEQIEGKKLDGRADLFAAGIVLYEVLTGKRPFDGDHMASIAYKILHEDPVPIQSLNPNVPDALAALVMRCLEKDPAARFATVREARNALRDLSLSKPDTSNGEVATTKHSEPPPKPAANEAKSRLPVMAAAMAGVALIGIAAAWFGQEREPAALSIATPSSTPAVVEAPVPPPAPAPALQPPPAQPEAVLMQAPASTELVSSNLPPLDNTGLNALESAPPAAGNAASTSQPNSAKKVVKQAKPKAKPASSAPKPEAKPTAESKPAAEEKPSEAAVPTKQEDGSLWNKITGCDSAGNCPKPKPRQTRDR